MLLFAFMGTMKAGVVEIGDGGTTVNSYLPTYTYYNYSFTQQIYTAEEIGDGGTIVSIAFYNNNNARTRNIDMYFVLTEKETFENNTDWIVATQADRVFSGSATFTPGQWNTIMLDTPFEYDGTHNLAVIVDDNSGTYQSNMSCYVFSATGQAIRIYSDGTNYDPTNPTQYTGAILNVKNQIQLNLLGPAEITANPSSIDMGYRPKGAWMAPFVVELNNTGFPATVTAVNSSNSFFTVNTEVPFTVSYGAPVEMEISTGTASTGVKEGNITVTYADNRRRNVIWNYTDYPDYSTLLQSC